MRLYQEILLLKYNCTKPWVVENVVPYYPPLVVPSVKIRRHLFWSNSEISKMKDHKAPAALRSSQIPDLQAAHNVDLSLYAIKNKRQILRNCVDSDLGQHVMSELCKFYQFQF